VTGEPLYRIETLKRFFYGNKKIALPPEWKRLARMLKAPGNLVRFQVVEFPAHKKRRITFDCSCMKFIDNPNLIKVLRTSRLGYIS
jgi:hypothetical protein